MSVYAWGANSHGQLGLGFETELCKAPQQLKRLPFTPSNVRSIRGGGGHVLILDTMGRVFACGWNNRGQLGLDSKEIGHNEFKLIPREFFDDVHVAQIACGWDISGCITVTKKLYVWGSNSQQQLGICPREFTAVHRPLAVTLPRGEMPRQISFGLRHCAILTEEHVVFIFGRLRINDPSPMELHISTMTINRAQILRVTPKNPVALQVAAVVCGQNHVLLKIVEKQDQLSLPRRIIALGDNKYGQGNAFQFESDIRHISVGWTHNAVLLKNNELRLWGRNCYGQLGIGDFSALKPVPVQLELPKEVTPARVHLGAEHAVLRTNNGHIYTWGWNEHGNCGNDTTENVCQPTLIKLPSSCRMVGCGSGFCYAICEK